MKGRLLWSAPPLRAVVEAWAIGLAILFLLSLQIGSVSRFALGNGVLFLCGASGIWAVLRARIPAGTALQQGLWELSMAVALSLGITFGLRMPAHVLGWEPIWRDSSLGNDTVLALLLLGIGPGYLVGRLGARLWQLWERLRRRRMLWALTHAHLVVVILVTGLVTLGLLTLSPSSQGEPRLQPGAEGFLSLLGEQILHTIFPGVSLIVVLTGMALVALLPPSALFSFLVARHTTRRLESLVQAARALRQGRYSIRVEVVGEDEVGQLQSDFNAMAGDLERTLQDLQVQRDTVAQLLQARRELVASVSHELRTPVATLSATLESALERWADSPPPSLRHDLTVMQSELLRLQHLIDDLLALSQAEAGGLTLDCRPVAVEPIVRRMVEAMAPMAWAAGRVALVAELGAGLPSVHADTSRLEQILANLLRNATCHTPPGGIVAVFGCEEPAAVAIEVRDTGEGIAPEDLPHIWERFYRGQGSRASHDHDAGAGLGLALVKELTEAMGGSVSVESRPNKGSCFTVRLPRA